MWWRFLTFCLLVSFILIIVLNYLHDRPVVKLFFKRCCDDGIENDVVFESFSNNYLKERFIAVDFEFDNGTFVPEDVDIEEVIEELRKKVNVHDPGSRKHLEAFGEGFKDDDFKPKISKDKINVDIEEQNDNGKELSNDQAVNPVKVYEGLEDFGEIKSDTNLLESGNSNKSEVTGEDLGLSDEVNYDRDDSTIDDAIEIGQSSNSGIGLTEKKVP